MASQQYPYPYYTTTGSYSTGTITISSTASLYSSSITAPVNYTIGTSASPWSTAQAGLNVSGDSNFDGDVKIKGRSLEKLLNTIERRLAILEPSPKKLAKFEALQKAYDHYKLLEALCHEEDKDG